MWLPLAVDGRRAKSGVWRKRRGAIMWMTPLLHLCKISRKASKYRPVMLKFRGIRGVGAEFLRKCSSGSLEKNLAFPIQSLWDCFFEEPKNGGLFAFLQQKLWDLVYQQSSSYTKRAGHRAWRPALFFDYITLFCLCRHHTVPESLRLHAGCSCRIPREHSSHQREKAEGFLVPCDLHIVFCCGIIDAWESLTNRVMRDCSLP